MNIFGKGAAALGLAFALAGLPAFAADDTAEAQRELEKARTELEKARAELQRATRDLARSMAKVERDNPRAQYFEYITNPKRAVLGVLIPDDVENGETRGVRLLAVTPGSGAEQAGLKAGDLVTEVNGASVARDGKQSPPKRMREALRKLKAGDQVTLTYERDGKLSSATVTTQAPEQELAFAPLPFEEWIEHGDIEPFGPLPMMFNFHGRGVRGLELAKLDEDLGSYFKAKEGVLVVKAPKSGALRLKSGDVIQKIDGDAVSEPLTVLDKLRARGEQHTVRMDIIRQGRKMEIEGTIEVAERAPRSPREKVRRIVIEDEDEERDDGR